MGKWQPRVPEWRANALATYRLGERWTTTLGARYSGTQFNTLDNSDTNPFTYTGTSSFLVFDARVQLPDAERWTASLGVDNLGNEEYWAFPSLHAAHRDGGTDRELLIATRPLVRHGLAARLDDPVQQKQSDDGNETDHEQRAQEDGRISAGILDNRAHREHAAGRDDPADVVTESTAGGAQTRRVELG